MQIRRSKDRIPGSRRRGFTLIEAALVTVIVGLGVVAMLELLATGTAANADGTRLTTAIHLARNMREMASGLRFVDPETPTHWGLESGEYLPNIDDIDDLDGMSFSPPIDGRRNPLISFTQWQQTVKVESIDPNRLTGVVPDGSTPVNRVTATILYRGQRVYELSWLAVDALD